MRARLQFAALLLLLVIAGVPERGGRAALARVAMRRPTDLSTILSHGFDVTKLHASDPDGGERAPAAVDVIVTPTELSRLKSLGFAPRILVKDLVAHYRAGLERAGSGSTMLAASVPAPPGYGQGSLGGYYTFDEMVALLDLYAAQSPTIVSPKQQIGTSIEGRPIWAVKISDHPLQSENEPRILLDGLQHAREPMSAHALLFLMNALVTGYGADPVLTNLVDTREIWFVPCVNPDGYVFNETTQPGGGGLWRKNRRKTGGACDGVDLNRNYPFQWGADDVGSSPDPCSEIYRGGGPGSEPETQAMNAFVQQQGCSVVVDMHSYGELLLHPFGVPGQLPANVAVYAEEGKDLAHLNGYHEGAIADVMGPANGSAIDQFHSVNGAIAWAAEIGTSFWPPTSEMIPTAQQNQAALTLLLEYAGSWVVPTSQAVVELSGDFDGWADPGETIELRMTVKNKGARATPGPVQLTLAAADPDVAVQVAQANVTALAPYATGTSSAFKLAISPTATAGKKIALTVTIAFDGFALENPLVLDVGTPRVIAKDDVETDLGWTLGVAADDATTGRWTRADPIGITQGADVAQPEDDVTKAPGTRCFVTGNAGTAAGQDDVDDGTTTLLSPVFDLTGAVDPRLRYRRFYWCSKFDDPFTVSLSNDGGSSWTTLEQFAIPENAWTMKEWRVGDFVPPTAKMRLRFTATDPTNDSVTEALVDEFEVVDYGTAPHLEEFGVARPGAIFELQCATAGGTPWVLLVALAAAQVHVPGVQGSLLVDPATLIVVPQANVPASGFARVQIAVPADPSLVGFSAWVQGVAIGTPAVFTNSQHVVISN